MYQTPTYKNQSFIPAIILFGALFVVGLYAGTAFAAMVNSNTTIVVNAESSHGANGMNGLPGSNGSSGKNGAISASVKIKTVVNGKVVQDIDEQRQSSAEKGIVVEVRGNNVVEPAVATTKIDSPQVGVTNRTAIRTINTSVQRGEIPSDVRVNSVSGTESDLNIQLQEKYNRTEIYSLVKSFFIHVVSYFRG